MSRPALFLVAGVLAATGAASLPAAGTGGEPVTCAGEAATIVGTPRDDTLTGTPGRDVIAGLAGDDALTGGGGDDLICGGRGDDTITALGGADRLRGGRGDDEIRDLVVGSAEQELLGGSGDDTLVFGWRVEVDGEVTPVALLTDLAEGRVVLEETEVSFPLRSFRTLRARYSLGRWAAVGTQRGERFKTHQYLAADVRAGGGRDVVHGSWHDDHIRGGRGRDTAYADRGRDTCRSVERGPLDECETLD